MIDFKSLHIFTAAWCTKCQQNKVRWQEFTGLAEYPVTQFDVGADDAATEYAALAGIKNLPAYIAIRSDGTHRLFGPDTSLFVLDDWIMERSDG